MKKEENKQLTVIPTAELLADMESLVVFGGKNDNDKGDSFTVSNCDSFKAAHCNCTFKDGGNCVAGCGCNNGNAGITIGGSGSGPVTNFP